MQWEIVIGLEVHAQLSTQSKIFSGASTAFGAAPNAQACAVDLALPGVLPVLNRGAVERAIRFGLAVGAKINSPSIFARKNYFYPDLPKGYQISQYEMPVVEGGSCHDSMSARHEKTVRLTRAHLEEDAGKSLHEDFHGMTGIDLNRAGTPLLEIVSEPDMRSSAEAVAYAKTLHSLVRWIGICDGNMQEGSFRCDANVSVRPMDRTSSAPAAKSRTSTPSAFSRKPSITKRGARSKSSRTAEPYSSKPGSTIRTGMKLAPCAARKTRRIIAISRIPICCRSKSPQAGSRK